MDIFLAMKDLEDYHFIVKIDKEDNVSRELAENVNNVDVSEWIPQSDILGKYKGWVRQEFT
jgi:hypothetical protein